MEKSKKLLLKKETIVFLNAENMKQIVGGVEPNPCGENAYFKNGQCFCNETFDGNPYAGCKPGDTIIISITFYSRECKPTDLSTCRSCQA